MKDILVSVLVISYNAEKYILDLLDSVKKQTYRNIELVIADDASGDHTVEIVREWIDENQERFVRTKLLAAEHNQGTVKNLNGGLEECNGRYVKIIAADDLLFPDCIERCLSYCEERKLKFVIGECEWVKENGKTPAEHSTNTEKEELFYHGEAALQYKMLLLANDVVCSPGEFYRMDFLKEYDFFDEQYDLIEDYPFFLKITAAGEKIHFMKGPVVWYRQSETSAKNSGASTRIYNERIIRIGKRIFYKLRWKGLLQNHEYKVAFRTAWKYFMMSICIQCGNSTEKFICKVARRLA